MHPETNTLSTQHLALLSLVTQPPDADRAELTRELAQQTALDAYTLRMRLGAAPPCIIAQLPPEHADAAVRCIRALGGDAIAPTAADIAALGDTQKIKDIRVAEGRLELDMWAGPTAVVRTQNIQIIVRAAISSATTSIDWDAARDHAHAAATLGPLARVSTPDLVQRSVRASFKIDIHTADRTVFQVDADKFGFRVLQDMRGYSDNENSRKLAELLQHLAPHAVYDECFSLFKPPLRILGFRLPSGRKTGEHPAFAFYSRWIATVYRHAMGAA